MSKTHAGLYMALLLGLLLWACTAGTPGTPTAVPTTATPVPPTATPTTVPDTTTPVPPTATPEPTAIPTPLSLTPFSGVLLKPLASDDAQGHLERGLAAFERDRVPLAVAHFTRAIELDPDLTDAYLYRGLALAAMDEWAPYRDFDRVIEDRPDDAEAYFLRALHLTYDLATQTGSDPCADAAKALELEPGFPEAMVMQGECVCEDEEGGADRAARAFDLFLAARALDAEGVDPFYAQMALHCFGSLYRGGQVEQIEQVLAEIDDDIAIHPDLQGGYFVRGEAILYLHEYTIEETVDAWTDIFRFLQRIGSLGGLPWPYGFDRSDKLSAARQSYRWEALFVVDQAFDSIWDDEIDFSGVDALMARDEEFKAKYEEMWREQEAISSRVTIPPEVGEVEAAALAHGGDVLATFSYGPYVAQFWGLDGTLLSATNLHEVIDDAAFDPGGRLLAVTGDGARLRLWDVAALLAAPDAEPQHDIELSADASHLAFSAVGSQVAVVLGSKGLSQIWSTETGELLYTVPLNDETGSIAVAPESHRVAAAVGEQAVILDTGTGEELFRLGEPCKADSECSIGWIAFSRDEKLVATAGWHSEVRVWDATTGELVSVLGVQGLSAGPLAFGPDNRLLAAVGDDEVVRLWDVKSGKLLHLMGHGGGYPSSLSFQVSAVAFSADGQRLLTGGADGTARLWDTETGEELATIYVIMPETSGE